MNEFLYKNEDLQFEGPLDLMLTLIAKHKLDILDLEIGVLLSQFLIYLDKMSERNIEVAGEFATMAARLIYIKSTALLPRHEAEEQELKRELSGALIEYSMCKQIAAALFDMYSGVVCFARKTAVLPGQNDYRENHDARELGQALMLLKKSSERKLPVVSSPREIVPLPVYVSVFSKIMFVLRRLRLRGSYALADLYQGQTRSERVAVFLALLELSKAGRVVFDENETLTMNTKQEIYGKTR